MEIIQKTVTSQQDSTTYYEVDVSNSTISDSSGNLRLITKCHGSTCEVTDIYSYNDSSDSYERVTNLISVNLFDEVIKNSGIE